MRTKWYANRTFLMAFICLGFILPSLSAAEEEPKVEGMIEIDYPYAGEAKVEVNLAGTLFALAAKAVRDENPEASEFLANLEAVKVRIYDQAALGDREIGEVLKFYEGQLKKQKWEVLARVKEEDSRVAVYSLTRGDIVSGLVVLVGGESEDIVIVNLAGNIDISKLSQIDDIAGIDLDLPELDLKKKKLPPEKEEKQKEQEQKAIKSFLGGNTNEAIALLEELEEEGISNHIDYALMAVLYHSTGDLDNSYYYLGRLYELENSSELSTVFYKKAVEINPQSEAAKRLGEK
jgi:tetratricopeptide (TPR) repeat protein